MTDEIFEVEKRPRESSLRDLYNVLFRHKWKILLTFCIVFIAVALVTYLSAKIYRSEAELLVRLGRETVSLDPTATTGPIITSVGMTHKSEIETEVDILRSRELAEKVVDAIGVEAFVKPAKKGWKQNLLERLDITTPISARDAVISDIMKNLSVNIKEESWIVGVSYEAKDPKLAQMVLNKLIEFYLEKHILVHSSSNPTTCEAILQMLRISFGI
jgi:uncharacterized protein involved in exopolysaccharide biosynthesis